LLIAACASAPSQIPLDQVTAATADVRVTAFNATVVVRVGQTLGVQPPAQNGEWQVDYDAESLRLVTPEAELTTPGVRGWVWQAVKAGESDLVVTSRVKCAVPPCAPNVAKFPLQVQVRPKGP
jgi:hypothetical protein